MNVHLLKHLTHYVRLYGPLWTHYCFWFESVNEHLLWLKHGTHHISLQVQLDYFRHSHQLLILLNNCNLQVQTQWSLTKSLAVTDSSNHFDSDSDSAKILLRQLNGHKLRWGSELWYDQFVVWPSLGVLWVCMCGVHVCGVYVCGVHVCGVYVCGVHVCGVYVCGVYVCMCVVCYC